MAKQEKQSLAQLATIDLVEEVAEDLAEVKHGSIGIP
jgi:hypothetical protein